MKITGSLTKVTKKFGNVQDLGVEIGGYRHGKSLQKEIEDQDPEVQGDQDPEVQEKRKSGTIVEVLVLI